MSDDSLDARLCHRLNLRERDQLLRRRRTVRPIDAVHVEIDGVRYVNFSSNNYLGLTHHPRVIDAVQRAANEFGVGAAASPLISGYSTAHASAEAALAKWKGTEAAVLLPSGYQANKAAIETIRRGGVDARGDGDGVRFLVDKLAHASIIDAIVGDRDGHGDGGGGDGGGDGGDRDRGFRIFNHNDLVKLQRLLSRADPEGSKDKAGINVVVTESIFSMDGDAAPLAGLARLKQQHPFFLLLDEAHGSGVYGPDGAGYAAELGLADMIDACVVTLSKALGCAGGAICGSRTFCDAVINFARAYIYSTAVPPTAAAACEAAIAVMRDEPGRQQRLRALAQRVRMRLNLLAGDSPIIPIVLGSENTALEAADALLREGLLVLPIRPPTVPRGTSRLRVTLSCEHSDDEVDRLVTLLTRLRGVG